MLRNSDNQRAAQVAYAQRLRFHRDTSDCHARAKHYAKRFNTFITESVSIMESVHMVPCSVYRLADDSVSGGFRYLAVEPQ